VRITLQGADAYDIEPRQLPNLYHGMPLRMYGRYRTAGPAKVRVQAEINGAAFDQTIDVNLPSREEANAENRADVGLAEDRSLVERGDLSGSRARAVDEIIRLGEGYSIVTEYTSFIVLENDAEYQRWKIDRRNLLRLARDRKQQQSLHAELALVRERALADFGPKSIDADRLATAEPPVATTQPDPPSRPSGERNLDFRPTVIRAEEAAAGIRPGQRHNRAGDGRTRLRGPASTKDPRR